MLTSDFRRVLENVRSTSVLSKIHKMFLKFLFSQSQFDHLRYNSLTLALWQKTARKSTRSYSFIAHSLATQEFPVIVDFIYWFSLHSCQNGHVLFATQYDNNTFPTHSPHMVRYRSICDNLCFNHTIWILSYLNHMSGNKTIISPWSTSLYFLLTISNWSSQFRLSTDSLKTNNELI